MLRSLAIAAALLLSACQPPAPSTCGCVCYDRPCSCTCLLEVPAADGGEASPRPALERRWAPRRRGQLVQLLRYAPARNAP